MSCIRRRRCCCVRSCCNESSEEAVAHGFLARAEIDLPLDEPVVASKKYYAI